MPHLSDNLPYQPNRQLKKINFDAMPISAFEKQALNNRITNLLDFVIAHGKLIDAFLVPIAQRSISDAETMKLAVFNTDDHPGINAIEDTGIAQAAATEANAVLARFEAQKQDLEQAADLIRTTVTHAFLGKPAATQFVDAQQTSLVRRCRDYARELVNQFRTFVNIQPLIDAKAESQVLKRYLEEDISDEEAFIEYVLEWSRDNPDV
jgi:hypothetical protein